MKTRLFVAIIVALGLVGCGNSLTIEEESREESGLPALGGAVEIATIGGLDQVLTYNKDLDVVCIENQWLQMKAARGKASAFVCWETSAAPKKMQELVNSHNNAVHGCGISAC